MIFEIVGIVIKREEEEEGERIPWLGWGVLISSWAGSVAVNMRSCSPVLDKVDIHKRHDKEQAPESS